MAGNFIDFKLQAIAEPFVAPAPFATGGGATKIFNTGVKYWTLSTGSDGFCYDTTPLSGNIIASKVRVGFANTNLVGASLINSSGNGYSALTNTSTNTVRIFRINAWLMNVTALWTSTSSTLVTNDLIELRKNQTTNEFLVYKNDVQLLDAGGLTYTDSTHAVNLAGAHTRNGYASTLESVYTPSQSITNTTSPIIPNATASWTSVGFANGASTLSFAGLSVPVTVASNAFTANIPMLADNIVWPKLPATGVAFTLTQGATSATVNANIALPIGFETVRDGSNNPANFSGLIADNDKYLAYHFAEAGNPLTINDTAVFPTSGNYVIGQDSGIGVDTDTLPRTDIIYVYRGASGKYFEHEVTVNSAGDVISVSNVKSIAVGYGIGISI